MATSTTTSTTTAVTTRDMVQSRLYLSMPRIPPRVYLETVNPHITCNLCKGYLIDARTIVDCLHSFCHSCIVTHLKNETYCPSCEMMINKNKPNIKPDATLQAIVYKLVPGLYERELLRRRAFYKMKTKEALEATPEQRGDDTEHLIFGPNESISLMLEYSDNDSPPQNSDDENSNSSHEINSSDHCDQDDFEVQLRKPKYLQCPAIFTISNLKKFLLHKFSINPNKFCVEIMYKVKPLLLPDHYTLMDVAYIFTWKRDAPMKFLYCVRAAHSPAANIEQSAVMYDLPPNRFQTNSQLACASDSTDHEQDQSSDADSEVRSDRTKEPETNGSSGRRAQHEPINSTSDEPSSAPSSSTSSTTVKTTSSATVTSTVANTSSKLNSSSGQHTSQVNGSENQKKDSTTAVSKEPAVSSPTTSSRMDTTVRIKSEPLSPSPEKPQSDRRSNGASPKPNTSKSRSTTDSKPSSPSRTNQDIKESKEKVKTKSIMVDSSATKSSDATTNRSEPKTVSFSDRPSSSSVARPNNESKPTSSTERPKGRLLFNKEEKAKSLSPPISAENEYDFDQHLLKEEFSTKKDFFEKIHLKPRTDSPLVQLPKMPKTEQKPDTALPTTSLSKDKDSNKISATTASTATASTAAATAATAATTTATTTTSASSVRPSVSSSSSSMKTTLPAIAAAAAAVDDKQAKKPENKASKRKSREPVKNVAKVKCASPNERTIDTKWDPSKSAAPPSSLVSTATPSNATSSSSSISGSNNNMNNSVADRIRRLQESPEAIAQLLGTFVQQNKNHLKSITKSSASSSTNKSNQASSSTSTPPHSLSSSSSSSSKPVFKTPITSSSKESSTSIGLKPNTSESETSIIINNVQRPTQADTPRPSMLPSTLKSNLSVPQPPYFFTPPLNRSFGSETEIQEIRNDDANIVYGPAMSIPKPYETTIPNFVPPLVPGFGSTHGLLALQQLSHQFQMGSMDFRNPHLLEMAKQRLNMQSLALNKSNKPKKLEPKRPSVSGAGGSLETKSNSLQKAFHPSARSIIAADAQCDSKAKQQNVPHGFRLPASTQIFATNEENEQSFSRSLYNKNSSVKNSIEIVKLPDETGNELNPKFPTATPSSSSPLPSSSSVDKSWQSNKNIANNQTKHIANQQNNQIDSTSTIAQLAAATTSSNLDSSFQAKFIDSLQQPLKKVKTPPQSKPSQPIRSAFNMVDDISRNPEAQKRKIQSQQQQQIDEIWPAAKSRKIQPAIPQQRSSPTTQRPVPDLLNPKDDRKVTVSNSNSSGSTSGGNVSGSSSSSSQAQSSSTNPLTNNKNASDHKSPTVSSNAPGLMLAAKLQKVAKAASESATTKYQPLQTSSTPMWANHCTIEHKASHKSMAETLSMVEKKNSSAYVD